MHFPFILIPRFDLSLLWYLTRGIRKYAGRAIHKVIHRILPLSSHIHIAYPHYPQVHGPIHPQPIIKKPTLWGSVMLSSCTDGLPTIQLLGILKL